MIHLESPFKTICQRHSGNNREDTMQHIWLLGKTGADLESKIWVLKDYTSKVDKVVSLSHPVIKALSEKMADYKEGFRFAMEIQEILPSPLRQLMGDHILVRLGSNCNGISLIAGGIFPGLQTTFEPFKLPFMKKLTEVPAKEIQAGDIVFVTSPFGSIKSFVYLDEDISIISDNEIYIASTELILDDHHLVASALRDGHERIKIYRKAADWQYPEEMMTPLMDFYSFAYEGFNHTLKSSRDFQRCGNIWRTLKESALKAKYDRQTDETVMACWNNLMTKCAQHINWELAVNWEN